MSSVVQFPRDAMASPWRRRQQCLIDAGEPHLAVIRRVGARSAFVETRVRPPLGTAVSLQHPDAGQIDGVVQGYATDGVNIDLPSASDAIAFALATVAADSSRP
jgi:hypothetical protein